MYQIRIQDSAAHELAQLDKQVARRLVKRIRWLAANIGPSNQTLLAAIWRGSTSSELAITALRTRFFTPNR